MKKIIRKGVFEINSSSCHSISVVMDSLEFVKVHVSGGIFYIYSNDFGWEQYEYSHYSNKCSYLAIYIRDWCDDRQQEFRNIFEQCIKDFTQCLEIEYEDLFWEGGWDKGHIDHQSVEGCVYHYLFDKDDPDYVEGQLKNFLFNLNSTLTTDNDNRSDYGDWMSW